MKVTFLGTGTSHGVPSIGCSCPVCTSPDPRDSRTRCAIHVEWQGRHLQVDTPPEFRQQAIRSHVRRVDALLFTHSHADHIFGLDDIRRYSDMQRQELPVYGPDDALADVRTAFGYIFKETQQGGGKPRIRLIPVGPPEFIHDYVRIVPVPVFHGRLPIFGYRFDRFAYVTDVSEIPPASIDLLRGLDTLVLGALRYEKHPTHFTVPQSLAVVEELRPRRTFFVHMSHALAHRETDLRLPVGVRLAYDGMVLDI